jgi:tRNA U34 5-carboxymethylaminomethyl modifying GTPase MnmE/TrmE
VQTRRPHSREPNASFRVGISKATVSIGCDDSGVPINLVALDFRAAVNTVDEIVGQTATGDLLDLIFRQFCIGN